MDNNPDRLYGLLPEIYHQNDAKQGWPFLTLLRAIAEYLDLAEIDMAELYENWLTQFSQESEVSDSKSFGDYLDVPESGESGNASIAKGGMRAEIVLPGHDTAHNILYPQRAALLPQLEHLVKEVAGWSAHAVEFATQIARTLALTPSELTSRQTISLRDSDALDQLAGPFGTSTRTIEVRRIISQRTSGRYNVPSVGLFVWRLKAYSATKTSAYCVEEVGPHLFTFSVLGNDSQLYTILMPKLDEPQSMSELGLPAPILRKDFQRHLSDYYGEHRSLCIWTGRLERSETPRQPHLVWEPVAPEQIIVADLSDWHYQPYGNLVAIDPMLGRIAFPPNHIPNGVKVSYHYGFSADIGGGEYSRPISQPADAKLYQVGKEENFYHTLEDALDQWMKERKDWPHAVIEIIDSGFYYAESLDISLQEHESLQIRAANSTRPVIRLWDVMKNRPDSLYIWGESGSRITLDGLLITGLRVQVEGNLAEVSIRHCTLVPGWELFGDSEPSRPTEPSLSVSNMSTIIAIEHSILGSIEINQDEVRMNPLSIHISDSILDATDSKRIALRGIDSPVAPAALTITRSTVFGEVQVHVINLAENSILNGLIKVARRQEGYMRFCYVTPGSRTPRRYNCQPDLVEQAVDENRVIPLEEKDAKKRNERDRVRPLFNSKRYGMPAYCQLAQTCAPEIAGGSDEESEIGVFHDLYQPQRATNLRTSLDEYVSVGMETSIIYVN